MRRQQSQSLVFLTEILMALTIYALCSSVCAGLFGWSHRFTEESRALSRAVIIAQSGASAFKTNSSVEGIAHAVDGNPEEDACVVYYDSDWQTTEKGSESYTMRITLAREAGLRYAEIVVSDTAGSAIFSLNAAALPTEADR